MVHTQKTFAKFFYQKYYGEDQADIHFRRPLSEMAIPMHQHKDPLQTDEYDIQFLTGTPDGKGNYTHGIPRRFWTQAMTKRFQETFKHLQRRQAERMPIFQKYFDQHYPQLLQHALGLGHKGVAAQKRAANAAKRIAEEAAEKQIRHIDYPEEETWELKPNRGQPHKVIVRPYYKELIQKIEDEPGLPGFDLWHPKEVTVMEEGEPVTKLVTRGFNFPNAKTLSRAIGLWLNHTAHRMLGELPDYDEEGITWKKDHDVGIGQSAVRDTFTVKKKVEQYRKQWEKDLLSDDTDISNLWERMFPKEADMDRKRLREEKPLRERLAKALAWHSVAQDARLGKVRTPPSKAHPYGQVIQPISRNEKSGQWKFTENELHLPHRKVKTIENGQVQERLLPMLLPGRNLRPVEEHEKEKIESGDIDPIHVLGHEKDYIDAATLPLSQYTKPGGQGSDHTRAGALGMPNENTRGEQYLPPGWVERDANNNIVDSYDQRLSALDADMVKGDVEVDEEGQLEFTKNPDGEYFEDIIAGIQEAVGAGLGGAGSFEKRILTRMFGPLHHLGYMRLTENLDDPKIYKGGGEEKGRPARRRERIKLVSNLVSRYAQQDWGRGSRKLRGTGKLRGIKANTLNAYIEQVREAARKAQEEWMARAGCVPGRGVHSLPTSRCEWSYDLKILNERLMGVAEETAGIAAQAEHQAEVSDDTDKMSIAIAAEQDATILAYNIILFMLQNTKAPNAEQKAQDMVLEIKAQATSATDFIGQVREMIHRAEKATSDMPVPREDDERWQELERIMRADDFPAVIPADMRKAAESMVKENPAKFGPRWQALQAYLAQRHMKQGSAKSTTPAPVRRGPAGVSMKKLQPLYDAGDFDIIAFNRSFQVHATAEQIQDVLTKLEAKTQAQGAEGVDKAALLILKRLLAQRQAP